MDLRLLKSKFAIVGGGRFCKMLLEYLFDEASMGASPDVLGVADVNQQAEGVQYARKLGLLTTSDYQQLYHLDGLQFLLELTMDPTLADTIRQTKPTTVELIDHIEARSLWTAIQLEKEKAQALRALHQQPHVNSEIVIFFQQFADHLSEVIQARNTRYIEIEREFVRSQWVLSQSIQGSTIPTFVIDENHRVTHWNRALEKLTGYAAREMVGRRRQWEPFYSAKRPSLADMVLDQASEADLRTRYGKRWQQSALIENAFEAEGFYPSLGEGGKWIWFTAAPIKSPDGRLIGAIETLWDKTEEKRAEHERERHTHELQTLFNSDPHPIFILDRDRYTILDINQRAKDIYGYAHAELVGIPFLDLCDKDDDELLQGLKHTSDSPSLLLTKKRNYRKGGRPFFVNINISPARFRDRDVMIVATTDISESVERETLLIQASKMTTIGQLAAGMAHEINQPLNVIQVCSDLLDKIVQRGLSFSKEEIETLAQDIRRNVHRASRVIQHVRDFARQSEVRRQKVNINHSIRDVFKVLGHQLTVHEVDLLLDLCDQLPWILADHNRLEQVFINLVSNAMDAMDEKRAHPEWRDTENRLTIRSFVDGDQVVVTVADSGVGMTEEVQGKLFDPFFTTKKVGKGTGLGVSISYGIVKDYDGTIDIMTQPGKGTTFELRFPIFHEHPDEND
jgi:PAS domain S-box-containing protein